MKLLRPLEIIEQANTFDVKCNVKGGGMTGQVGAMVHGISKALIQFDLSFKSTLKKENLLQEILELLNVKNMVIEKLEEASNSLKDNIFLINNCYI